MQSTITATESIRKRNNNDEFRKVRRNSSNSLNRDEAEEAELVESLASFSNHITESESTERPTTPIGAIGALMDVVQSEIISLSPTAVGRARSPHSLKQSGSQHTVIPESPFTTMAGQVHRPHTLQSPTKSDWLNNTLFALAPTNNHQVRSPIRTPPGPRRASSHGTPVSLSPGLEKLLLPPLPLAGTGQKGRQVGTPKRKEAPQIDDTQGTKYQRKETPNLTSPLIHDNFIFDASQLPDNLVSDQLPPETPVRDHSIPQVTNSPNLKKEIIQPYSSSPLPRVTPTDEDSNEHAKGNKRSFSASSSPKNQISLRPQFSETRPAIDLRNAALRGGKVAQVLAAAAATHESNHINASRPVRTVRILKKQEEVQLDDDDDEPSIQNAIHRSGRGCTCKNSRCLKLYCDCFAAFQMCSDDCGCNSCLNLAKHSSERDEAIANVLKKNKYAFDVTKRVCKCQRSKCLKKYCECFNFSMNCSDACKCIDCANYLGSPELAAKRQQQAAVAAPPPVLVVNDRSESHQTNSPVPVAAPTAPTMSAQSVATADRLTNNTTTSVHQTLIAT